MPGQYYHHRPRRRNRKKRKEKRRQIVEETIKKKLQKPSPTVHKVGRSEPRTWPIIWSQLLGSFDVTPFYLRVFGLSQESCPLPSEKISTTPCFSFSPSPVRCKPSSPPPVRSLVWFDVDRIRGYLQQWGSKQEVSIVSKCPVWGSEYDEAG